MHAQFSFTPLNAGWLLQNPFELNCCNCSQPQVIIGITSTAESRMEVPVQLQGKCLSTGHAGGIAGASCMTCGTWPASQSKTSYQANESALQHNTGLQHPGQGRLSSSQWLPSPLALPTQSSNMIGAIYTSRVNEFGCTSLLCTMCAAPQQQLAITLGM